MSLVLDQPHLIDTLRYKVFVHRRATQDQVRVTVQVTALVKTSDRDHSALEKRIHATLKIFIASEWTFARIERSSDATGYERVSLVAGTRIPATENYDLEARSRAASTEGLAISNPNVSYAVTRDYADVVVAELMEEILAKATAQAGAFSLKTGREWRIGDVEFGVADMSSGATRTSKGAYRDDSEAGMPAFEATSGGLSGVERIWLMANVTLKAGRGTGG